MGTHRVRRARGLTGRDGLEDAPVRRQRAARTAGLGTILAVRPDNLPQPSHDHEVVTSFDQIR